jgi:hypothetical protein
MIKLAAAALILSCLFLFFKNTYISKVALSCVYILNERYSKRNKNK